jgi:hypothetical protein
VQLIDGLEEGTYELLSPRQSPSRSTLVYVTHRQRDLNESVHRQRERRGVDIALRDGNLRFSPHLYKTADDVDRALHLLAALPARHRGRDKPGQRIGTRDLTRGTVQLHVAEGEDDHPDPCALTRSRGALALAPA